MVGLSHLWTIIPNRDGDQLQFPWPTPISEILATGGFSGFHMFPPSPPARLPWATPWPPPHDLCSPPSAALPFPHSPPLPRLPGLPPTAAPPQHVPWQRPRARDMPGARHGNEDLHWPLEVGQRPQHSHIWGCSLLVESTGSNETNIWVCLKIGYIPNYSHLVGIMIINHWV